MVSWFVFGSVIIPALAGDWTWHILVYTVLSLTLVRGPVAITLIGSRIGRTTVLFVGWFGPRGLASIVFALIALEDLHGVPGPVDEVIGAIGLTVLLSVLAHGSAPDHSPAGTPPDMLKIWTRRSTRNPPCDGSSARRRKPGSFPDRYTQQITSTAPAGGRGGAALPHGWMTTDSAAQCLLGS
jgi:hypothetical protein